MAGGKGQNANPKKINPKILSLGIKTELEHTRSKCIAMWIAVDHITELGPGYYKALMKMEKGLG